MKISSISNEGVSHINTSQHINKPEITSIANAAQAFISKLDQMNIAIALSEAGDVDGAKALLSKQIK